MTERSVFEFLNYKSAMKYLLRGAGKRGALSRTAETLNCQRSYLSRILNFELHLTPDQAFLFAKHWLRRPNEREYFQVLVEYERAGDRHYREELQAKLKELKRKHDALSERVLRPAPSNPEQSLYFSAWYWSAIHFLTSSNKYQTVVALSEKTCLPQAMVLTCLEQLEAWSFVRQKNGRWEYLGGEFHLPSDSPFVFMHHQNWRNRAIIDSQMKSGDSIHYTNIQTISSSDLPLVKELHLKFINECNKVMGPSKPEEAVVLTCDLFKL
jgi:hypothetical protein